MGTDREEHSMTVSAKVAVMAPFAYLVIDYRTGRTQLITTQSEGSRLTAGAVVIPHRGTSLSWGTNEVPAVLGPVPVAPLLWRLGAVPALVVTAAVSAVGSRRGKFWRMVRLSCCGRRLRPASRLQAEAAVRAIRWASSMVPARWACLEQSAAAAVLLAVAGRRAEWQHGAAPDPWRLHAWIADYAGVPVEEPADTALYTPTYTPDGPVRPAPEGNNK
jgi:Transglutaminase-like superfamily